MAMLTVEVHSWPERSVRIDRIARIAWPIFARKWRQLDVFVGRMHHASRDRASCVIVSRDVVGRAWRALAFAERSA